MELRRLSICLAFFVLAVISHCSEARHTISRRASDYESPDDIQNDESNDYGAQNDADGGNDADEDETIEDGVIESKADNYRLQIGKSVRLECKVSPAGAVVVSWTKDETKLFFGPNKMTDSKRYSLADGSSDLIIKDLEISDTGRYRCEIIQATPASITHVVIVEQPPLVTNPETSTEFTDDNEIDESNPRILRFIATDNGVLREGSNLLLTCDVTGTPKPSIIWSRHRNNGVGGTEALTEANGEFSDHTLFMKNVSKDDSGVYYCYAVSDAGNATSMLHVHVIGKPSVYIHTAEINTDIGVEAELKCTVHDDSTPHIRWYKDDHLIEDFATKYNVNTNFNESTLTVTPETDADFGTFTCEAENVHGKHNKSINLVQSSVIEGLNVDGPKLTWTVHSHQPLEDIEVLLKERGEKGEWKSFTVPLPETKEKVHKHDMIYVIDEKALDSGTYEATVKVRNNKGSSHSEPVIVELENQALPIQTASVFRSAADSIRPTTVALSTAIMYLLVRML